MIFRIEKDTCGKIKVFKNNLWGSQTQRSLKFFNVSVEKIPLPLIFAIVKIKKYSAKINFELEALEKIIASSIILASECVIKGKYNKEFPLSVWQTGSGTQSNMNVNEVISNISYKIIKFKMFQKKKIHPNDHINLSQSSNDLFPSSMHISILCEIKKFMIPSLNALIETFSIKSKKFHSLVKIGRTHLQDATPITLGQEFSGYVKQLKLSKKNIYYSLKGIHHLALGGTAIGTGLNSHKKFGIYTTFELFKNTGISFISCKNKFQSLSSHESLLFAHGALKSLASGLMKISNDIRWMSSGPRSGLGEINIPCNEPGSSIMPGKVNPTQCESITMIVSQILGNDVSINICGSNGNFELNVYKPTIIYNFLQTIRLLSDGIYNFNNYCIAGVTTNNNNISKLVNNSLMLVTSLSPNIGYEKSAKIVKRAYKNNISLKESAVSLGFLNSSNFDKLIVPINMTNIKNKL